jgi:hypothetical protein
MPPIIPDANGKTIRTIIQNTDGEGAITISFTDGEYLVIGADLRLLREPKRPLGTVSSTPMFSVVLDAVLSSQLRYDRQVKSTLPATTLVSTAPAT